MASGDILHQTTSSSGATTFTPAAGTEYIITNWDANGGCEFQITDTTTGASNATLFASADGLDTSLQGHGMNACNTSKIFVDDTITLTIQATSGTRCQTFSGVQLK